MYINVSKYMNSLCNVCIFQHAHGDLLWFYDTITIIAKHGDLSIIMD
jgi:hypothetical protein